jgi:hypothetical protein
MSISGGVTRGVPVVIMSSSIGAPYTLIGSHRLVKETLFLRESSEKARDKQKININYLEPLVIMDARSKRKPSTCISVTQYLQSKLN